MSIIEVTWFTNYIIKKYESFYKMFTKKWWDTYYERFLQSAVYINAIILLNLVFILFIFSY